MNKFEQLIEYVINNEDAKAEELFHEIVVEKSRGIYESLMDSDFEMGGDEADELMNDISADEEGMHEDEDEMEPEMGAGEDDMDMGGEEAEEEDLEDRVVDLEDQLDALMAEFDELMGHEAEEGEMDMDMGGEEGEMDMGGEEDEMDMGGEEDEMMDGAFESSDFSLEEALELKKVSKGIANSTEEGTVNKKSTVAHNSGAKGAAAKPHQKVGEENGRSAPEVKLGDGTTEPRQSRVSEPKKKGEDAGVNKKSLSGS